MAAPACALALIAAVFFAVAAAGAARPAFLTLPGEKPDDFKGALSSRHTELFIPTQGVTFAVSFVHEPAPRPFLACPVRHYDLACIAGLLAARPDTYAMFQVVFGRY